MPIPLIVMISQQRWHTATCICGTYMRSGTPEGRRILIEHHCAGRADHCVTEQEVQAK